MITLLYPYMLWGTFALLIPIVIHFWYQKKGKTISWAAMPWLTDQTQLQPKGYKLDEILLLLLRCLLLLVLILFLSKPIFSFLATKSNLPVVHLVQPDAKLVNEFKFELQMALDKGEKVYWVGNPVKKAVSLSEIPVQMQAELSFQSSITQLAQQENALHLYLWNDAALINVPAIQVPDHFKLHAAIDSTSRLAQNYWSLNDTDYMSVASDGDGSQKLITYPKLDKAKYLTHHARVAHQGPVRVALDFENDVERRVVKAALESIQAVFAMPLLISDENQDHADWVFSDRKPKIIKSNVLYIISNQSQELNPPQNLILLKEPFLVAESDWVRTGQLPAQLMEILLTHLKLNELYTHLSAKQLESLFVVATEKRNVLTSLHAQILMLLFLILLIVERYISLTKATRMRHE